MEALVALTLSAVVIVLVSTVFLVQNRYYADQMARSQVQDNARSVTELIAAEIRSVAKGGVRIAESDRMVVRSPMALVLVCDVGGSSTYVYLDGGLSALDTAEVSGFAVRDTLANWSYYNATWSDLYSSGGNPASRCASAGADTTGATANFIRLRNISSYHGSIPPVGSVLMLFRETEFRIQTSVLEPAELGLFRGIFGDSLVEFATGMDSTAGFLYRVAGAGYASSVSGGNLSRIDAIRLDARARMRSESGGRADLTFGWDVSIPLRNLP